MELSATLSFCSKPTRNQPLKVLLEPRMIKTTPRLQVRLFNRLLPIKESGSIYFFQRPTRLTGENLREIAAITPTDINATIASDVVGNSGTAVLVVELVELAVVDAVVVLDVEFAAYESEVKNARGVLAE